MPKYLGLDYLSHALCQKKGFLTQRLIVWRSLSYLKDKNNVTGKTGDYRQPWLRVGYPDMKLFFNYDEIQSEVFKLKELYKANLHVLCSGHELLHLAENSSKSNSTLFNNQLLFVSDARESNPNNGEKQNFMTLESFMHCYRLENIIPSNDVLVENLPIFYIEDPFDSVASKFNDFSGLEKYSGFTFTKKGFFKELDQLHPVNLSHEMDQDYIRKLGSSYFSMGDVVKMFNSDLKMEIGTDHIQTELKELDLWSKNNAVLKKGFFSVENDLKFAKVGLSDLFLFLNDGLSGATITNELESTIHVNSFHTSFENADNLEKYSLESFDFVSSLKSVNGSKFKRKWELNMDLCFSNGKQLEKYLIDSNIRILSNKNKTQEIDKLLKQLRPESDFSDPSLEWNPVYYSKPKTPLLESLNLNSTKSYDEKGFYFQSVNESIYINGIDEMLPKPVNTKTVTFNLSTNANPNISVKDASTDNVALPENRDIKLCSDSRILKASTAERSITSTSAQKPETQSHIKVEDRVVTSNDEMTELSLFLQLRGVETTKPKVSWHTNDSRTKTSLKKICIDSNDHFAASTYRFPKNDKTNRMQLPLKNNLKAADIPFGKPNAEVPKIKVIEVSITGKVLDMLCSIQRKMQTLMNKLHFEKIIQSSTELFSCGRDLSSYFVKTEANNCTNNKANTSSDIEKLSLARLFHLIVSSMYLFVHVSFESCIAFYHGKLKEVVELITVTPELGVILNTFEDVLSQLKGFAVTQTQASCKISRTVHPKIESVTEYISTWVTKKLKGRKVENIKVLIVCQTFCKYLNSNLCSSLKKLSNGQLVVAATKGHTVEYTVEDFVAILSKVNVLIISTDMINKDFPMNKINLLVEYERDVSFDWKILLENEQIHHVLFRSILPNLTLNLNESENVLTRSEPDSVSKDPHAIIGATWITKMGRLLHLLETRFNILVIERNYDLLNNHENVYADIILNENSCILISSFSKLNSDDNNYVKSSLTLLLMLQRKFTTCYFLIAKLAENDQYILRGKTTRNLGILQSSIRTFQQSLSNFKVHVMYCFSINQLASSISVLNNKEAKSAMFENLTSRTWLKSEVTESEQFLLKSPCINSCVAQLFLHSTSLGEIKQMTFEQLEHYYPSISKPILLNIFKWISSVTQQQTAKDQNNFRRKQNMINTSKWVKNSIHNVAEESISHHVEGPPHSSMCHNDWTHLQDPNSTNILMAVNDRLQEFVEQNPSRKRHLEHCDSFGYSKRACAISEENEYYQNTMHRGFSGASNFSNSPSLFNQSGTQYLTNCCDVSVSDIPKRPLHSSTPMGPNPSRRKNKMLTYEKVVGSKDGQTRLAFY